MMERIRIRQGVECDVCEMPNETVADLQKRVLELEDEV